MKLAHSTCLWLTKELPIEVAAKEIAAAGYEGIEPLAGRWSTFQKEDPQKFKDLLTGVGLELASVLLVHMSMEDYKAGIDFVQSAGADRFTLVSHVTDQGKSREENLCEMAIMTDELAAYAADRGMTLSFHTHSGAFIIRDREDIDDFFGRLRSDNVRLCFDAAQLAGACIDLPQLARDYADLIDDVHFKDITRPGPILDLDGRRDFADVGEGIIDWPPVAEALKAIGYDGWLVGDNDFSDSPIESARQVHRRIKTLMG